MSSSKATKFGRRYPWKEWFARKSFVLVRGRDFDCLPHAMAQMVRNTACSPRYRLRVQLSVDDDGDVSVVVKGKLPPAQRAS